MTIFHRLYKGKDGKSKATTTWWYRFRLTIKDDMGNKEYALVERSGQGRTKLATEKLAADHRQAIKDGKVHWRDPFPPLAKETPKIPTFSEYAKGVWENIGPSLKPRTVAFYEETEERIKRFGPLADAPLDRINVALVDSYKAFRAKAKKGNSPAAVAAEIRTIRRVLHYAHDAGLITGCPRLRAPKVPNRERVIAPKEEVAYLKQANGDLYDAAIILLDCGLRPDSELFPLRWEDVSDSTIRVAQSKTQSGVRVVRLTARVKAILEMRKARTGASPFVFPRPESKSGHLMTLKKQHYKACETAGLNRFPIYTFRHTFGTRCAEAGMDRFSIAKLMGHSNPAIAEKYYIKVSDRHVQRNFEMFEKDQIEKLKRAEDEAKKDAQRTFQ